MCELDCNSPAGDVFPRSPSESPLHFADHRDESVIVGYYTSEEVHLRSPSPSSEPRKEGCPLARNDGIDRTSVRNLAVSDKAVGNTQQHNEREKDSYRNPDIIPQRTCMERPLQKANRQLHRPICPTGSRWNHFHARPEAGCHPLLRACL